MRSVLAALVTLLAVPLPAPAAVIQYTVTQLGADAWRYEYTVTNDGSTTPVVALFDVLFDPALYDETSLSSVPSGDALAGWDIRFLASGLLVPAAYDALALTGGIGQGETASGFAVEFVWRGIGTPGPQPFEIYSPDTFELLGTGTTVPVPLPAGGALLAGALLGTGALRVRRARPAGGA